jgi:predicted nucleic acid-binding protein
VITILVEPVPHETTQQLRIYLDVCCLNRPFDDQTQTRVHLESEAVKLILDQVRRGELRWITSEVVDYEIERTSDATRRANVRNSTATASESVRASEPIRLRAAHLNAAGFDALDALHLAAAESGNVDVLLTTDDALVRRAIRLRHELRILVRNPLTWLREMERKS